jgi:hypothetical protein
MLTRSGREDPRLNLCDLYLFEGPPGRTVMAMTVNPAATPGTAAPFREEGLHVLRFDTDGDAREDVSFKVRFGQIDHRRNENDHVQSLEVRRAAGQDAGHGARGELLAEGCISAVITGDRGIQVFAGVTADQCAGDATALESFEAALAAGKYTPEAFENHSTSSTRAMSPSSLSRYPQN